MPRKKKPTVPVTSPGQPYGVASDQAAAMDMVPMAQGSSMAGGPAPGPAQVPPPGPVPPGAPAPTAMPTDPMAAVLGAAQGMEPPPEEGMFGPSERPDEDVMTMPAAAAPAPSGLDTVFAILAEAYDDDYYHELAAMARARRIR